MGSSPRLRGVPWSGRLTGTLSGIIPASAGSTAVSRLSSYYRWDHPRVCGEYKAVLGSDGFKAGSSPRLRGVPGVSTRVSSGVRDHPRVCGEYDCNRCLSHQNPGSSPRMRGVRQIALWYALMRGIIPASAGSTGLAVVVVALQRDHLRVCGEYNRDCPLEPCHHGSSPRLRGVLQAALAELMEIGIIPASAGSTSVSLLI